MEAELELKKVTEIKGDLQTVKDKVLKLDTADGIGVNGMVVLLDSLIEDMEAAAIGLKDVIKLNQE